MSSQTDTTATAMVATTGKNKRFELPALEFAFGSLTDGTDIPPPLPSPIQEETVPTPPDTPQTDKQQQQQQQTEGTDAANGKPNAASPESHLSNSSVAGTKRRADDLGPASPTLSSRPSSIRRLFSRGLLNPAHNGDGAAGQDGKRPPSRGGSSITDSRKSRRSSGWFGRLRSPDTNGVASKPVAPISPPATDEKLPLSPPPPMIPELSELNTKLGFQSDTGFGNDLFKDIK